MRFYMTLIIFLIFTSGGAYYYYTTTQSSITLLTTNNATLKSSNVTLSGAVTSANETIDYLQDSYDTIQEDYDNVVSEMQIARKNNRILVDKIEGSRIANIGIAKPQLTQDIINNATDDAFRCFELLSGSPLTNNERNAENAIEFNKECPWFFNGSISD